MAGFTLDTVLDDIQADYNASCNKEESISRLRNIYRSDLIRLNKTMSGKDFWGSIDALGLRNAVEKIMK